MILAEELSKKFDDFLAVDRVSFHVSAGEVLALLGPNGAGKTTTVRMLTSILTPTGGSARVAGYDVVREPEKVRASVGVLTEHHGLYGRMTADEYLEFFGRLYGLKAPALGAQIDRLMEEVGLGEYRRKRLGEYSKGMRQKLALVRALLHDPPVLLLDEPTSAMDPESARIVHDAIRGLRSAQRSIILCTHNLPEAEELADQVAIIRRGRIILKGTPSELKRDLLGPAEYEAHFAGELDGQMPDLPAGASLVSRGADWIRVQVHTPETTNPKILRRLLRRRLEVVTWQEVPRSLEEVYLEAVSQTSRREEDAH